MVNGWKLTAIVFIILFGILFTYNCWAIYYWNDLDKQTNICYYDVCEIYPDAYYDDDLCTCYEYDILGELIVAKTKYMK